MKLSAKGLEALVREEGLVTHPYNDSAGHATIGVGHLIHLGRVTAADQRRYASFTRADAIRLLRSDVAKFEGAVDRAITRAMLTGQNDAFVSLAFNIGAGGFASSTAARRFNAGDRMGAANAFLMWDNPPELRPRRVRERAMYLAAKPATDPLHGYTESEKRWIREYDELAAADRDLARRRVLRRVMGEQRQRIWQAAEHNPKGSAHGWAQANRRERWTSLRARSDP